MTKSYQLPFSIMPKILNAVADISELLGRWSALPIKVNYRHSYGVKIGFGRFKPH